MKDTRRCPKCASRRILFVRDVADASHGYETRVELWQLVRSEDAAGNVTRSGFVQACVCQGCGFTELYVWKPETLVANGKDVILLGAAEDTPYR
ncbi:MAG: hypothetical protein KC776_24450 [Myxococcales bacterium]|nr:hypothetical protein [Myxococcales bacterium]MCB9582886.1 hypothetical protein [Polyangiaceae bacterium]